MSIHIYRIWRWLRQLFLDGVYRIMSIHGVQYKYICTSIYDAFARFSDIYLAPFSPAFPHVDRYNHGLRNPTNTTIKRGMGKRVALTDTRGKKRS